MLQAQELRDGIKTGDLPRIKQAIDNGANLNNALPGYSFNALYLAIDVQNIDAVKYLIDQGCDIDFEDWWYNCHTPLTFAIQKNSPEIVAALIARGADVNRVHSDGDTPLTHAVRLNKLQIVELLLKQKADVNQVGWKEKNPLSWAVTKNNIEAVKLLVSNGADKNGVNGNGTTPLELARATKNYDILEFLEKGTNKRFTAKESQPLVATFQNGKKKDKIYQNGKNDKVTVRQSVTFALNEAKLTDSEGNTPLINAIIGGKIEAVHEILANGADPCKPGANGKAPLSLAVQTNNIHLIELLLNNGAEHTIQTALLEAIIMENVEIVQLFLERGALANVIYKNGCTPLTRAIDTGRLQIVQALVENGANVNMPDRDGNLPVTLAVKRNNIDIAKYLIDSSQLPDAILDKCTFLLKYIDEYNFEMVELLVELGVKLNVVFDIGTTPLTKAVQMDNFKMVRYFVEKGADVNLADNSGKVPVALAAASQNLRIVKFLIEAGADISTAKKEIDKYASVCEDFAIYLDVVKGKYKQWESKMSIPDQEVPKIDGPRQVQFIGYYENSSENTP